MAGILPNIAKKNWLNLLFIIANILLLIKYSMFDTNLSNANIKWVMGGDKYAARIALLQDPSSGLDHIYLTFN